MLEGRCLAAGGRWVGLPVRTGSFGGILELMLFYRLVPGWISVFLSGIILLSGGEKTFALS